MIMIDIENLGLKPGSHILSIGWALFDWDAVYESDEYVMGEVNGEIDLDAVRWWMAQPFEAQRRAFALPGSDNQSPGTYSLARAIEELRPMTEAHKVWTNGPSFDQAHLDNACARLNLKPICSHRDVRCYRTITDLAHSIDQSFDARVRLGKVRDATMIAHSGQGDAIAQALVVIEAFKVITGARA